MNARLLYTLAEAARLLGMGRDKARAFCAHHGCLVDDGMGGHRVSAEGLAAACTQRAARERRVRAMPRADLPACEWD